MARVLIVEDEPLVAKSIERALHYAGHSSLKVSSGAAALKLLETEEPFDLAIVDYNLGDMTGAVLVKHIEAGWPSTPIIMVTGYAEKDFDVTVPVLPKPFTLESLVLAVGNALATRRNGG